MNEVQDKIYDYAQLEGKRRSKKKRQKIFIEAMIKCFGIVTLAENLLAKNNTPISAAAHYDWMRTDADYKKQIESISERSLDYVESKLMNCVNKEEFQAIKYYLSCHGRKRGYVERSEVFVKTVVINITEKLLGAIAKYVPEDKRPALAAEAEAIFKEAGE